MPIKPTTMFIEWERFKEESPMTLQVIERATGFAYDPAYGVLSKSGRQITSNDLFAFFDEHGWYCQVYKMHDQYWNAVITDSVGNTIYNDGATFEAAEVKSRPNATSLIFSIALGGFEEQLKKMVTDTPYMSLFRPSLREDAAAKHITQINFSDLCIDAQGLCTSENTVIVWDGGEEDSTLGVVVKNTKTFPFVGMTVKI